MFSIGTAIQKSSGCESAVPSTFPISRLMLAPPPTVSSRYHGAEAMDHLSDVVTQSPNFPQARDSEALVDHELHWKQNEVVHAQRHLRSCTHFLDLKPPAPQA